jgi:hypothetical protein
MIDNGFAIYITQSFVARLDAERLLKRTYTVYQLNSLSSHLQRKTSCSQKHLLYRPRASSLLLPHSAFSHF